MSLMALKVDQVKTIYKDFLRSPSKLNSLLPLLDTLKHCTDDALFEISIQAILGSLRKCIEEGLLFGTPQDENESNGEDAEDQLKAWTGNFFWSFLNILLDK